MANFLSLIFLLAVVAADVTLTPLNGTLVQQDVPQRLLWKAPDMIFNTTVFPLGSNAGLGKNPTQIHVHLFSSIASYED